MAATPARPSVRDRIATLAVAAAAGVPAGTVVHVLLGTAGVPFANGWGAWCVTTAIACGLMLVPAARVGPALVARFDAGALAPPTPPGPVPGPPEVLSPGDAQRLADLREWCLAGSGPGASAWWQPWARPALGRRFAVRRLTGADAPAAVARMLCLDLDGSLALAACPGAAARLALRLRVKRDDCLWWRKRRPEDPWDAGYARADAPGRAALARFMPRRATLVVVVAPDARAARETVAILERRQDVFDQPVRALLLDDAAD